MLKKVCGLILGVLSVFNPVFSSKSQADQWVDSLMNQMSPEERLGQLFMVAAYADHNLQQQEAIQKLILDNNIGGLVFIKGEPLTQVRLVNQYQQTARIPLLVAMNGENGPGSNLDGIIEFPELLTTGAIDNPDYLYNYGAELARQYKILGIQMHLGLGVDVFSNLLGPSGVSSMGQLSQHVAHQAGALMEGLQDNGITVAAKFFPGLGSAVYNDKYPFPVLTSPLDPDINTDLYPFQQLIKREIRGIMTSNSYLPAENEVASLSGMVVNKLLRQELGFSGLVISDALNLQGLTRDFPDGEVEVKALQAGNDLLLFPKDVDAAISRIRKATEDGRLDESLIDQKVKKILRLKYQSGLNEKPVLNPDNLLMRLNAASAKVTREKMFEKAVTVVRNEKQIIPVRMLDTLNIATLSIGSTQEIFKAYTGKYCTVSHYDFDRPVKELRDKLARYNLVMIGIDQLTYREDDNFGLRKATINWLRELNEVTNVVIIVAGTPFALSHFDDFPTVLTTYEEGPLAWSAGVQVIFGALPAAGKLPVTVSQNLPAGTGLDTPYLGRLAFAQPESVGLDSRVLDRIDDIATEMVKTKAAPGCQVLIAKSGKVVFERSYGFHTYDSLEPVTNQTVYDLASISKVAGTLQGVMFLADRNLIDLHQKASNYLPELATTNKAELLISDILTHQAGLIPTLLHWRNTVDDFGILTDYYSILPDEKHPLEIAGGIYGGLNLRDSVWQWTIKSELRRKADAKTHYDYKYSDLGFYMMHHLVEKSVNQDMDQFLKQNIYDPLGLPTLTYRPLCHYSIDRIVPTEEDQYFRHQVVRGMVHDPGAAMYGGVAGHAGLFSNAFDLAALMQMNLQGGYYGGDQFFAPQTLQQFTRQHFPENRRGLGWDKPSYNEDYEVTSRYASPETFGHTGFTGTAVWVDPEFDLVYVFLSNRVYPDASNVKLIKNNIRTRIHDKIYEALWSIEKQESL